MNKWHTLSIILAIFYCLALTNELTAQTAEKMQSAEIENYKEQAKRLIGFLEFALNTLGDKDVPVRDKEVIINESYLKAFMNSDVQVEDDLDLNRAVITNKDVQAYLKDVDFFFKHTEFEYQVQEVQPQLNENGDLFFKVIASRSIKGLSVEGDSIFNSIPRYIELNVDTNERVLKIASIYTTKMTFREDIAKWWNELPGAWKNLLAQDKMIDDTLALINVYSFNDSTVVVADSLLDILSVDMVIPAGEDSTLITISDTIVNFELDTIVYQTSPLFEEIGKIMELRELNISGNLDLQSLDPLSKLDKLEVLDMSNTLISDLFPVRNLTNLRVLNISGTPVSTLDPLIYNTSLKELILDNTPVSSTETLQYLVKLEVLHMNKTNIEDINTVSELGMLRDLRISGTAVSELSPLSSLGNLEQLDISASEVENLSALEYAPRLQRIYLENSNISNLTPLSTCPGLTTIYANNSKIDSLEGLEKLELLSVIYCDSTGINEKIALEFMQKKPEVLVIYESEALFSWWQDIPEEWKRIFSTYVTISMKPTKEELHQVILVDSIDINGNQIINSLHPLERMSTLRYFNGSRSGISQLDPLKSLLDIRHIDISSTTVSDLSALSGLTNLEQLNCSDTKVNTLEPLSGLVNLKEVLFEKTGVDNIMPLTGSAELRIVYADETQLDDEAVDQYLLRNPDCLVIYASSSLSTWWNTLSPAWQRVFQEKTGVSDNPTREELHKILYIRTLSIDNNKTLGSLDPLSRLRFLEELSFNDAGISQLSPLADNKNLKKLVMSNNPIEELQPLLNLTNLNWLDLQNTPISDISLVTTLIRLQFLNISGTGVKKLDALEESRSLMQLECNNTDIKSLKPLLGLSGLKSLKCYNTKIPSKKIEEFKAAVPGCEVVFY